MIFSGIIIYIFFLVALIYFFRNREGYFSTITVFGLSGFTFYLIIPLEAAISNKEIIIGWHFPVIVDSNSLKIIVFMSLISLGSFAAGYFLSGFYPDNTNKLMVKNFYSKYNKTPYPLSLILLLIIALIIILTVFSKQLFGVNTYFGSYYTNYTYPVFFLTANLLSFFLAILVSYQILISSKFRILSFCSACILFFWGIYSSDKDPILLALLSTSVYFFDLKKKKKFSTLLVVIIGGVLFLLSFPLFSLFRAGYTGSELIENYYFSTTLIDPAGPFYSLLVSLMQKKMLFGSTYITDLLLIIPKFMWEKRPLGTAEYFAREIIPYWQPGQGVGYSLMAEAYNNFGCLGAFLTYFVIGLVWGIIWKILKNHFLKINFIYFQSIYLTVGFYLLILMHRAPAIGLIKNMIHIFFFLLPISLIFNRYYLIGGKIFRKYKVI